MTPKYPCNVSNRLLLTTAMAVSSSLLWYAAAANVTWDTVAGDNAVTGGTGPWDDLTTINWTTNGGTSNVTWNNAANDTAVFSAPIVAAATITLDAGGITVGGLNFSTGTATVPYVITASTLTLAGATPTVSVATGVTGRIDSVIATANGLTKTGPGSLILQGGTASSYTADTTVTAGQLGVNFAVATTNLIAPTSQLVLNGGALSVLARSNAVTSQTFNEATIASGHSVLHLNKQTTSSSGTLVLTAITRNAGATVNLFTSGTGGATRRIQSASWPVDSTTILESGVAYATFQNLSTSSGPAVFSGNDWAAYNGSTLVPPTYNPSNVDPTTLTGNADISTGTDTILGANATITSLRNNIAEARTINLAGNTLTTGGILIGSTVGTNTTTITGGTLKSAATAANKDLVIIANNTGITGVGAIIANADAGVTGLTKSGTGNITLSGANSYTGPTIINAGSLTSSLATALSSTSSVLIGSGSALTVSYGGANSYTNPQITTLLAKATFADATSGFGFDTTDATGGTADFAGGYSASTGLAKSGVGTLVLTGANSHTGITSVFGGTLKIADTGSLGGTALGTLVSNGAAVALEGGITITGETLSILGDGISQTGALRNISGTNSWTSDITLAGTARISADTGTLNLGAVGTSGTLLLSGNGNITVSGLVTGTTGVTVEDLLGDGTTSGTMTLSGVNTNTGTITVASGRLDLTGSRTAPGGAIVVGNTAGKTGTLKFSNGSFSTGANSITVGESATGFGVVDHTAGSLSTGANFILVGSAPGATGTYTLSGGTLTSGHNNINAFILGANSGSAGTFNLGGSGILIVDGGGNANLQIGRSNSTTTSSYGTFNQSGGTATVRRLGMGGGGINNDNTISQLILTGGVFSVTGSFSALSAGDTSSSSILIGGTAEVTLPAFPTGLAVPTAMGSGSTATITFDGGTLKPTAASAFYMGGLTEVTIQDGGARFDVATGKDIVIAQALLTHLSSLGGGLTKLGAGVLSLSGVNTYTGPTAVNEGTLGLEATCVIDPASTVNIASGATLAGTGTAAGTLASMGNISPGTLGVGTLTTGPATLSAGALEIEVTGATADQLISTGLLNLAGASLTVSELVAASAPSYVIAQGTSRAGTFATPTLPPGYTLTYTSTQVILNTPTSSNYSTWAVAFSSPPLSDTAATADPDNDGLDNLEEYALGLDPRFSSPSPGVASNGGKTITFIKGAEAKVNLDVTYKIETSISLGAAPTPWTEAIPPEVTETSDTIAITFPNGQTKNFARLKVVLVP